MKKTTTFEIKRQIFHIGGILFVLASYLLDYDKLLVLLLISIGISASYFKIKNLLKIQFFDRYTRVEEIKRRFLLGATTLLFSITLVLLLFRSIEIFRVSALVLILGDSFSTMIGKVWGKHKIPYNRKKSLEGCLAFLTFAFLGALTQLPFQTSFLISALGMFIESLPLKLDDNLTIPLAVGFVLWLISI